MRSYEPGCFDARKTAGNADVPVRTERGSANLVADKFLLKTRSVLTHSVRTRRAPSINLLGSMLKDLLGKPKSLGS